LEQTLLDPDLQLLWVLKAVPHCGEPDVQREHDHEGAVRHVAPTLDDVLRLDFKRGRVVDLFEIAGEVALVIVFPLYEPRNLVGELRVRYVVSRPVHRALVAALQRRHFLVVPEAAPLVARLVFKFAAHDVEDEGVARDLLIGFDFDDVTRLDAAPVRNLEAFVPLRKDELLDRLAIHFLGGLPQLFVVQVVQTARGHDGGNRDENHMRVVGCFARARDRLRNDVNQEDQVVELKKRLVQENCEPVEALYTPTPQTCQ